ncbi:hypothetical protein PN36_35575, partial [Candidatus Thiomargarita nelsonii]
MLIELAIIGSAAYWLKNRRKNDTTQRRSFSSKKLLKDLKSALMQTEQQKSQELMQGDDNAELQKLDRSLNHKLVIATSTLVAVFISPFTPIATILATVGILYLS